MSEEKTVWNDGTLDKLEYLGFSEENKNLIKVKFLENNPKVTMNRFNTPTYEFDVMDMKTKTAKIFAPSSKRLMISLEKYLPIEGKTFDIKRIGEGMETDYEVNEVK